MQQTNLDLLHLWSEHPMTELFLKTVKDHVNASKEHRNHLLESRTITEEVVQTIKQLNGQVYFGQQVLNIKNFMIENVERLDDEREDFGAQSSFEDGRD